MNPSTASNRLVKDILFRLAVEAGHKCFQCGGELDRSSFSIEHKVPWIDSENPKELFFDLDNIAFSHHKCNVGARRHLPSLCGTNGKYSKGCRCEICKKAHADYAKTQYTPEKRKLRYINSKVAMHN